MVDSNVFLQYGTDYETVLGMLRAIAFRIVGCHRKREYIEELLSEGWLTVCELLQDYDPSRGKLTTYLWIPVYGALLRYAVKKNHQEQKYANEVPEISTDCIPNSGIFENPWAMQPDLVYEKKERFEVFRKFMEEHQDKVTELSQKTPKSADWNTRQHISRRRRRALNDLQNTAKGLLDARFA